MQAFVAAALLCAVLLAVLLVARSGGAPARPAPATLRTTTLVLDLDETLVHTRFGEGGGAVALVRPHAREFLTAAGAMFGELVLFTAAAREYADDVVDQLDPGRTLISRRFYRDSCTPTPGGALAKDLRRVAPERDVAEGRVLLLDNTPASYALQPRCGVPIGSWFGEPADRALPATLGVLAWVCTSSSPLDALEHARSVGWLPA